LMHVAFSHRDPVDGSITVTGRLSIMEQMRVIRAEGGIIGPGVHEMLTELRDLAKRALEEHEDELANEILQLVLAEKLRRKDTF
jgi:hypothetical protein